jgi:uncharacterized protein YjeT (DUF2065 family)
MSLGFGDGLTALGLVEGLVLAVTPEGAKRAWAMLMARPPSFLRASGLAPWLPERDSPISLMQTDR